jgi:hypothetical protein
MTRIPLGAFLHETNAFAPTKGTGVAFLVWRRLAHDGGRRRLARSDAAHHAASKIPINRIKDTCRRSSASKAMPTN